MALKHHFYNLNLSGRHIKLFEREDLMDILDFNPPYIIELFLILILALLLIIVTLVLIWVGIYKQKWNLFAYIAILCCFSQSMYGAIINERLIYARGVGKLFFPLIEYGLVAMCFISIIKDLGRVNYIKSNLKVPYLALLALFVGNLFAAYKLDIDIEDVLSSNGIINLVLCGFLFFLLIREINLKRDLEAFTIGLMAIIAVRGIFGIARFAFWGGDPANVYGNVEHIGIKLTYFDICDSQLACVGVIYALRKLLSEANSLNIRVIVMLGGFAFMELAVIILSYRRAHWAGLAFAMLLLITMIPSKQRWLSLLASLFLAITISLAAAQRLSVAAKGLGIFEGFFYDFSSKGSGAAPSTRLLDLKYATATALEHPIFGLGIWGRYEGYGTTQFQNGPEAYAWVHSSPIHLMLKTGIVGLSIVSITLILFARFVLTSRKLLPGRNRYLFDAAIAGLVFMIPDFFFTAQIIQFRTTQLYALLLAIPYIVVAIYGVQSYASLPQSPGST
jgi:hypothetical protein